jgi:hypothetical protein
MLGMRILFKVTIRSAPAVNDSECSVHHSAYQTVDNRLMIDESETIASAWYTCFYRILWCCLVKE